jgi:hypothetical protein
MGFSFAGKAVYTAAWVAAASLFMELLGFSTQKWLTAGGLGTVLLTLAGREVRSSLCGKLWHTKSFLRWENYSFCGWCRYLLTFFQAL